LKDVIKHYISQMRGITPPRSKKQTVRLLQ